MQGRSLNVDTSESRVISSQKLVGWCRTLPCVSSVKPSAPLCMLVTHFLYNKWLLQVAYVPSMPWWDACAAAAGSSGLPQPDQQSRPSTAAACSAATASGLAAAALDPTATTLNIHAEQGQQVCLSCATQLMFTTSVRFMSR